MDSHQTALNAKRIGTPVFARLVACDDGDRTDGERLLGAALDTVRRWLNSDTVRLTALGNPGGPRVSVLIEFSRGQTALVSAGTQQCSRPLVESMIVGTRRACRRRPR